MCRRSSKNVSRIDTKIIWLYCCGVKLDHRIMKFKIFHWPSHRVICSHYSILYNPAKRASNSVLGAFLAPFYFSFYFFEGIFNKTIIPLGRVGYPTRTR